MSRHAHNITRARILLTRYLRPAWEAQGEEWGDANDDDINLLIEILLTPPSPPSPFPPQKPAPRLDDDAALEALNAELDAILNDNEDPLSHGPNDLDDDRDALASAGFGTDEDYFGFED